MSDVGYEVCCDCGCGAPGPLHPQCEEPKAEEEMGPRGRRFWEDCERKTKQLKTIGAWLRAVEAKWRAEGGGAGSGEAGSGEAEDFLDWLRRNAVVVTHEKCTDGAYSAALLAACGLTTAMAFAAGGGAQGDTLPGLMAEGSFRVMVFVDTAPTAEIVGLAAEHKIALLVLDHHVTAKAETEDALKGVGPADDRVFVFGENRAHEAGCTLAALLVLALGAGRWEWRRAGRFRWLHEAFGRETARLLWGAGALLAAVSANDTTGIATHMSLAGGRRSSQFWRSGYGPKGAAPAGFHPRWVAFLLGAPQGACGEGRAVAEAAKVDAQSVLAQSFNGGGPYRKVLKRLAWVLEALAEVADLGGAAPAADASPAAKEVWASAAKLREGLLAELFRTLDGPELRARGAGARALAREVKASARFFFMSVFQVSAELPDLEMVVRSAIVNMLLQGREGLRELEPHPGAPGSDAEAPDQGPARDNVVLWISRCCIPLPLGAEKRMFAVGSGRGGAGSAAPASALMGLLAPREMTGGHLGAAGGKIPVALEHFLRELVLKGFPTCPGRPELTLDVAVGARVAAAAAVKAANAARTAAEAAAAQAARAVGLVVDGLGARPGGLGAGGAAALQEQCLLSAALLRAARAPAAAAAGAPADAGELAVGALTHALREHPELASRADELLEAAEAALGAALDAAAPAAASGKKAGKAGKAGAKAAPARGGPRAGAPTGAGAAAGSE